MADKSQAFLSVWVYKFVMQTSQQASEWCLPTEPKPKKPHQSRSKIKVILTVFLLSRWCALGILSRMSDNK